jgi:high affinity sulfate transporter 1
VGEDVGVRPPPVFTSLHGYRRAWISADLVAGLTLLSIAIPEQLATSRLAGMPPITGFYAFIAGTVVFALIGSNPQVSVGADSTIAPLFAAGVTGLATLGSPRYVELVAILAVMVGLLVALIGLVGLGWIAEFLSTPIVTGFLSGVAVIIVIHQLPDLFGFSSSGGTNEHRVGYFVTHLSSTNGWSLAIGIGVLALMFVSHRIDRRIPGALIALIGSAALVTALDLQAHGVAVLGTINTGWPHFGLTGVSWSTIGNLAPLAAVVALVIVTQTAATTRAFAEQGAYDVDVSRDFAGTGAGSILAGFVGSFPVNASPPRTGAVVTAGGRTQAGALGAALVVLLLLPVAGVLKDVPLSMLAAVLIYIAIWLFRGRDLLAIARFDAFEFALALVTLLAVVLVGVEQGIAVAVALALLDRIRISARPQLHVLGLIPGSTSWQRPDLDPAAAEVPGVRVALFAAPVWYANAQRFRDEVVEALHRAPKPHAFVLEAIGQSDIDYTGLRAMEQVVGLCEREGIAFGIARAGVHLHESLRRAGLATRIGEDRFFPTVDEAVKALSAEPPPPPSAS